MAKPRYTMEFRLDAVRLVTHEGYSAKRAADAVGVAHTTVASWVTRYRDRLPEKNDFSSEQDELAHLREENRRLRMERDILKKAAVFFAKEEAR